MKQTMIQKNKNNKVMNNLENGEQRITSLEIAQLTGKPHNDVLKSIRKMETVVNAYGIRMKRCCASCGLKEVDDDGNRICTQMQLKVAQKFVCRKWQMSDGLKNAGLQRGGVVRLKETKETIID